MFELSERMLSFVLTTSTPGVVIAIENRTQNDATGPVHARVTLMSILQVLRQKAKVGVLVVSDLDFSPR